MGDRTMKRYANRPLHSGSTRPTAGPRAVDKTRPGAAPRRAAVLSSAATNGARLASARRSLRGTWRQTGFAKAKTQARPATRLDYGLYLPTAVRATRVPLMVMLHGCKQTARE